MSATNFQPIFDYIDEVKKEMSTKEDIAKVLSSIDAFALNNKNNYESIHILIHKAETLEHWALKVADKIKVPYKP